MNDGPYRTMLRESTARIRDWNETGIAQARAEWERRVACWLLHPLDCRCLRGGR